jgi:predicted metal-dependent TIM-barrel fold hydrolase
MVEKTTREHMLPSFGTKQDKEAIDRVIDIIMDEFIHDATAVIDHKFYLSNVATANDYLDHSCIVKYLEQLYRRITPLTSAK